MFLSDVGAQLLPVASDIYRTYTLGAVVMVITRGCFLSLLHRS
eukprot:COSAG01_NODE_33670_length_560_cov_2.310195_1_plen_42_part_10